MVSDLLRQYAERGFQTERTRHGEDGETDYGSSDEVFLLTGDSPSQKMEEDGKAVETLAGIARSYFPERHGGRRLRCHLLLQSDVSLHLLQRHDLSDEVRAKLEVCPFTLDEAWGRSIVLDYEPITVRSQKTVHLVVFGMTGMGETVAVNAALTAHYPNYTRDTSLRTRVTLIDEDAINKSIRFRQRYRQLFDNSYYRVIDARGRRQVTEFHCPECISQGIEGFTDVEWEFVQGTVYDPLVRDKLRLWAGKRSSQLLTIVFALGDEDNIDGAAHLPGKVYETGTPVYVRLRHRGLLDMMGPSAIPDGARVFGMADSGYDTRAPLTEMAKTVNYLYDACYHDNIAGWTGKVVNAAEIDWVKRERLWLGVSADKRTSNICHAMTVATKMRSVGLGEEDWDEFHSLTQPDIETLAEVEHNRWCVEELILGWRPCTREEQRSVEEDITMKETLKRQKTHYDLRPYHDLRPDATGKPSTIYDLCLTACLPLIARSHTTEGGMP